MPEKQKIKCRCGQTTEFESANVGCTNIGEAMKATGWNYCICEYNSKGIWLCQECAAKAKTLANELFKIVGSPFVGVAYLMDQTVANEWRDKQDEK